MKKKLNYIALAVAGLALMSCGKNISLGGEWLIDTVGQEKVVTSEKTPFLEFDESSSEVHGCLGVNIVNGRYALDGSGLSFDGLGMTMMAGLPQDMEVEYRIQQAIESVASVKASGNTLVLLDGNGSELLTLVKK